MNFPFTRIVRFLLISAFLIFLSGSSIDVFAQQSGTAAPTTDRQRGIDFFRRGEIKSAIQALTISTKQDKADGEAWYYLGLALARNNQYDKAGKAFEASTKLQPEFGPGHTAYSYALLLTGKTEAAGKEARRAIELDDRLAEAHYVLGVVHLRDGKLADAELEAGRAIRSNPSFPKAHLLKSQALLGLYAKSSVAGVHPGENATEEQLEKWREERAQTREFLKQATAAMESFVSRSPAEQTGIWGEQLATMRVHLDGTSEIFRSADVTTRAKVLRKPEPSYTEEARNAGVEGTVVMRAVFASDGKVKHILVLTSLPYGLTEAAVEASRRIKFIPATKDGKPVSMWMQLEYNFSLY
ncbi:MAG TPA: TonB family protein [Pyrinomonadaceae bacterium]|nr:TonB family protein [Pyrinomonadaceae bacterium]